MTRTRVVLLGVALAWATAAVIGSGSARADALCLDQAHNFVPCPAPTGPLPTTGFFGASRRFLAPPVVATRPPSSQSGRTGTLLLLGFAAVLASVLTLVGRRLIVDRGFLRSREPEVVDRGPLAPDAHPPARSRPAVLRSGNGAIPDKPIPSGDGADPDNPRLEQRPPRALRRTEMLAIDSGTRTPARQIVASGAAPPLVDSTSIAKKRSVTDISLISEHTVVSPAAESPDLAIDRLPSSAGPVRLHQLTVDSLAQLAAELDAVEVADSDLVLALPPLAAIVLAEPGELVEIAPLIGGICVAASAVPQANPALAERLQAAIAEAVGTPVLRCQCFPNALFGPAAQLRSLLVELPDGDSDADRLTAALLANRQDLVLDIVSFFFHLLDGTGTDVAIVAGRAHVGGKQPLVLIDPSPSGQALASAKVELADRGAGDLARLLRYDGAAATAAEVTVPAPEVRVTQLWSPSFCATVIRAAEVSGLWKHRDGDDSTARAGVSLVDLFPRLLAHLEADLARRVWPLLNDWRPLEDMTLSAVTVTRQHVGGPPGGTITPDDTAAILGSVRLNDGYTGGALLLPRQRWDDGDMPVGALALWPSGETHPEQVAPVTRGVKYTLNLWLRKGRK